jgi:hypothetical protein|tara:strand:+ start:482 stop:703 length:222 start_codon:yes stop_codon:yes gene_type:complete
MSNVLRKELFKSLVKRYESDIQSNKSTMLIYFNNSVGIGEHPQHLEEMDVLVGNIVDANDKLESLLREFGEYK